MKLTAQPTESGLNTSICLTSASGTTSGVGPSSSQMKLATSAVVPTMLPQVQPRTVDDWFKALEGDSTATRYAWDGQVIRDGLVGVKFEVAQNAAGEE
eukprot:CAMPEP_0206297000 /NCGR_PEP_ID=MMETSP0106_2-20121207/5952_1 /ASSEMBLY_ACC=CAM_ASM_000206 /TAXON_ID=81532 /ORGANISM="Acanthoeca-like sp., Strain 10tr" /LENGTH=97 /DNA_ID=CAMNT_0053727663 /DNA_START=58 /DNA_END=352 /DNA_ORIENTATION=-